jgi:DNA-directed RNA polymerase subunit P
MYKCVKCKKIVTRAEDKIRCPFCGYRIYVKMRPDVVKRVHAR